MRLFCKALDYFLGVTTSPSVGDLGELFQTNMALLRGKDVLLPMKTSTGRKRQRNENSWAYIAQKYERLELLKKKAAKSFPSLPSSPFPTTSTYIEYAWFSNCN